MYVVFLKKKLKNDSMFLIDFFYDIPLENTNA